MTLEVLDLDSALAFLRAHQPLPHDGELEDDHRRALRDAIVVLRAHPAPEALPLLLGVPGGEDPMYAQIDRALGAFPDAARAAALRDALSADSPHVRYWAAHAAASHPSEAHVEPLAALLREDDYDMRAAAISALARVEADAAKEALDAWLPEEEDPLLRGFIREALGR